MEHREKKGKEKYALQSLKKKGKRKEKRYNPVPFRSHSPEQTAKTLSGGRRPKKKKKKAPIPSGDAAPVFADTLKRQPGKDEEAEKDQKKDMDQKRKEKGRRDLKRTSSAGIKEGSKKGEKAMRQSRKRRMKRRLKKRRGQMRKNKKGFKKRSLPATRKKLTGREKNSSY